MNLQDFFTAILTTTSGTGLLLLCLSLIKIKPLEINLLLWIALLISKPIVSKIDAIDDKLTCHIENDEKEEADAHRWRILNMSAEIRRGVSHTLEEYNLVLEDIDKYESYCNTHPGYKNSRAKASIEYIQDSYRKRLENNDFLV